MRSFWRAKKIILIIFFLAIFFRFNNLNWDSDHHLQPDERFLTMVGNAIKIPKNIFDYLNPQVSTLNPNNVGYNFFVYGTLPLTINKIIAVIFKTDNYNDFTVQGRFLSGIADLLIVLLVYKLVTLLEKKYRLDRSIKYWAAFFYAIAVFPIQLSHFFSVDTFLSLFMLASFYFVLRFYLINKNHDLVFSALFFGLAMACKVTAIFILPLNLLFILFTSFKNKKFNIKLGIIYLSSYALISSFFLYLGDPYIFNKAFFDSLKYLKTFDNKDIWYPPGVQWINKKPIVFSLINLIFFGVGLPYFILIIVGVGFLILNFKSRFNRDKFQILNLLLLWVLGFFIYQSTQYVKSIRYFIFLYPFLAIFAGIGVGRLSSWLFRSIKNKPILNTLYLILCTILLLWPLMFSSIYMTKNSRVEASEWIYENLPNKSAILGELWDDPLPLYVKNTYGKQFITEQLPVFDYDTTKKWQKIDSALNSADYYILSSNRGWGSIPTVPEKYPLMSKFYNDLLSNKTDYKIIKKFTSYPSLRWLGIPFDFPDQWSEEAFTVYDHPKVIILKNTNKK